jgi:beta-aspartyl-dipeptidase (metallo-type)
MLILKNADLYAPTHVGVTDILLSPEKILAVGPGIEPAPGVETQVIDCAGLALGPALVDQHMHILGGGGESGPRSRIPEIMLTEITRAGIGTVVGLLGADGVTRGVPALLAKARALEDEGLTTRIYTGSYGLPTDTLTGRVLHDLVYVEKVAGAGEVAISDYRSSHPNLEMLRQLAWEVKLGSMIGKKAGVVHLHVGDGSKGLAPLISLIKESEFPMEMFVPTHINRNRSLLREGADYARSGGYIDLTAGQREGRGMPAPEAFHWLLSRGVPAEQITVSSDAGGTNPLSPDGRGHPADLMNDFAACARGEGLEAALALASENPARRLGLHPEKGSIAPGGDADLLVLGKNFEVEWLILKGKIAIEHGICRMKGQYEA